MIRIKTKGTIRDLTYKYNQFLSEETDKKKSHNDSQGEIIESSSGKL